MKKKILAAAVLGSIGVMAHAQSSVTLYGIIDAGISYVNHSGGTTAASGTTPSHSLTKFDDGVAQGSRWGIRGTEDLGGGMSAIFLLENGFNVGNGTLSQGSREFGRQAFVGLSKSGIGSMTFGRQYSFSTDFLSLYSTGSQTVAGNYGYHINDFDQLTTSRIDNAVKFTSANFAGLTFGALYGFSNVAGAFGGTLGAPANTGSSRTFSFGANYAAGPLGVGAAYTDIRYPSSAYPSPTAIANITTAQLANATPAQITAGTGGLLELRTFGAGARYLLGPATLWALYTNTRFVPITGKATQIDAYEAGAKYAFTPALTTGLGYTYMNIGGGSNIKGHWNQIDASVDYALSKRTDVYVLGIYQIASGHNGAVPLQAMIGSNQTSYFGTSGTTADNQLAFRVGIRHKF
jgi:predicted porin